MIKMKDVARTLCKDGFVVSTVHLSGLGQSGGDYETFLATATFVDSVERYPDGALAISGHTRYVCEHGGRSLLDYLA